MGTGNLRKMMTTEMGTLCKRKDDENHQRSLNFSDFMQQKTAREAKLGLTKDAMA